MEIAYSCEEEVHPNTPEDPAMPKGDCPSTNYCDNNCKASYTVTVTTGPCVLIGICSGTYVLSRTGCNCYVSHCEEGDCLDFVCSAGIFCENGIWKLSIPGYGAHCEWHKPATGDSCPAGTYIISVSECNDCDATATVV